MSAPTPKKCVPFSVSLAVLAPDNKRQVSFGITKGCNADDTAFWLLHFVLRDKVEGGFQDRVVLDVRVNAQNNPLAEKLASEGITRAQLDFLQGPITSAAKKLPAGTTSDEKTAAKIQQLPSVS
jgi:hypothetical protein